MPENKSRFVLVCQHSLAFGLVVALTAPAASVVSLDIVPPPSAGAGASAGVVGGSGEDTSAVAVAPVEPTTTSVALSGVSQAGLRALDGGGQSARLTSAEDEPGHEHGPEGAGSQADELAVLSAPEPVEGLATVGVTWSDAAEVDQQDIAVAVRTFEDGAWSAWTELHYHEKEGPDPGSAEGRLARPGTDPIFVGGVDDVQVRAETADGVAPADMKLALVDPGATDTRVEEPAIDPNDGTPSASLSSASTTGEETDLVDPDDPTQTPEPVDDGELTAGPVTAKPVVYSRGQWGADERMRDRSSLRYGEVHAGFVHHTVNANYYSRRQVPSIIRGIYAYHTQSRGWSDVGYNFLVDRFGRIWEGRAGGVGRPVVGAHTLGYNDDSFAMSAIGNFETARPSAAMLDAYGRLFAWKLSLHGVNTASRRQWVTKRYLPAINGHRDAGSTACPGRYLYAKLPTIRALADRYQRSWAARKRYANLVGNRAPDLVVRDRATKQLYVVRTGGAGASVAQVLPSGTFARRANILLNVGDWNGDGRGDVVTRSARTGRVYLYRGNGQGRFAAPRRLSTASFARVKLLAAVGDMTGEGRPDLMGQPSGGAMRIYPGTSRGFRASYVARSALSGVRQVGVGLWTGDGAPDTLVRRGNGAMLLYPGNGPGGLMSGRTHGTVSNAYDWSLAMGDVTGDGRVDLAARTRATGDLWLLPGTARGFGERRLLRAGMSRFDLAG